MTHAITADFRLLFVHACVGPLCVMMSTGVDINVNRPAEDARRTNVLLILITCSDAKASLSNHKPLAATPPLAPPSVTSREQSRRRASHDLLLSTPGTPGTISCVPGASAPEAPTIASQGRELSVIPRRPCVHAAQPVPHRPSCLVMMRRLRGP